MAGMNTGTAISLAVAAALLTVELAEAAAAPDTGIAMHAAKMPALPAHLHGWDTEFVFVVPTPVTPPPPLPQPALTYAMQQQDPYWDNHAAIQNSISQSRNAEVLRNAALLASLNRPQENSQPRGG